MKTKDEIRRETPLSVTSTDNAIYEVEKDNHYRWGEANRKVIIPDSNMKYISGNLGPRI